MVMVRWMFVVVIAMMLGFVLYVSFNNGIPEGLGVTEGQLAPCPEMPNCVSTQASPDDSVHYVEPVLYHDDVMDTQLKVEQYILQNNDARIIQSQLGYSHIEVSSPLVGFNDDLELYFPEADSVMHIRSASRIGYDDFGANRERVRQIRDLLVD